MTGNDDRPHIYRLTDHEGGGYLIEFPDLRWCLSDGDTIEEEVADGSDARRDWLARCGQPPAWLLSGQPRTFVVGRKTFKESQ